MDYYKILGVSRNASAEEIRRAWRRQARRSHPDSSGDPDTARFREIQEAYETLSDLETRAAYDSRRETEVPVRIIVSRPSTVEPLKAHPTRVREVYRSSHTTHPAPEFGDELECLVRFLFARF